MPNYLYLGRVIRTHQKSYGEVSSFSDGCLTTHSRQPFHLPFDTTFVTAQEYEFSHCPFQLDFQDNGASWAGRAQMWMFDLFEVA
jgi:hypothetical protein